MISNNYLEDGKIIETTYIYTNHGILVKNIKPAMEVDRLSNLVNKKISNLIKKEFEKNINV